MKARRAKPRRRVAPQEDMAWWEAATLLLAARSGGLCERCNQPLYGRVERHHRMRRRDGGDRISNLLFLDPECHRWVTEHPADARDRGWIVATWETPEQVPVWIQGGWWLLHDDGTRTRTTNSEEQ